MKEELKEKIRMMAQTPSPYIRNHGMKNHSNDTLTNAYRKGYNQCLLDILQSLDETDL